MVQGGVVLGGRQGCYTCMMGEEHSEGVNLPLSLEQLDRNIAAVMAVESQAIMSAPQHSC